MKHILRIFGGLVVATTLVLTQTPALRSAQSEPANVPGIDKPVIIVSGDIQGVENWTNGFYWVLRGAVFIRDGAVLNIQAGTTIIGEAGTVGTLIVEQGGKLNAIGTPTQPIVFTSGQAPGTRARGDWGGIIINGRAAINVPGGVAAGEANTGTYGGGEAPNADDDSGTMQYVRVEFAGTEFSPDNELNGIAFQGVGRGGRYDHIQIHMNRDDGLEWFGGTADIKYAVVSNAADDSFDWTQGWTGRAQFVLVHQRGDDADWGIEADNNEFNFDLLPLANPQIYNMTICADPDRNEGSEAFRSVLFRRGTAVTFRNFVITGHRPGDTRTLGMQITDSATVAQVNNNTTQIGAGIIFGPATPLHSSVVPFVNSGRFPGIVVGQTPGLGDCTNHAAPDFQPVSADTLAGGLLAPIQPPADGFFEPVTFVGGMPPAPAVPWTDGWTAFPQN
ncbi:MAG: hypothetical protein AB7F99_05580 [Vicinamibacterales bacterium]